MRFRNANNADRKSIEGLIFPILESYGLKPSPESTDSDLADIESIYFQNGGIFDVLVNEENEIVGTVAVHRTEDELCELRKMYLSKTARGHGNGKRLFSHAIDEARKLGYKRIWLETADALVEAKNLYTAFGFSPFEGPHQSPRCDLSMVLDL